MTEVAENGTNGHHNGQRETEEERRIRKERERKARENETEEERRIRKERERKARENETEEERRIRKEKERKREKEKGSEKRKETEEERRIRKEKERREKDKKDSSKEKDKHRKRKETEEERRIRKEKEKRESRKNETEEERRIRKEKEKKEKRSETEEERAARKERERKEKKDREQKVKEEVMELGDDYFAAEEAKLDSKRKVKDESEGEQDTEGNYEMDFKNEEEEDSKDGIIKMEVQPEESDDDDEKPLAARKKKKRKVESGNDSDDEDEPLSKKKAKKSKKRRESDYYDEEEEEDFKPKAKTKSKPAKSKVKNEPSASPTKKMTKKEKEAEAEKQVWKWWEESEQLPEGVKWRFLEHQGPLFAPEYEPLPDEVRFWYDGKVMRLSEEAEEAAGFYGRMLDHDYTTKEVFNKNFFKDWRKCMTEKEKDTIRDLSKCDFSEINEHFKKVSEERKNRSKEEKKAEKENNEKIVEEYGFCMMDGHKERIGNFRIEPPGLFRGRGEHPKQGMIKRRTMPEDVIINCSKDSRCPDPPRGHKWKKVQHDNSVTWLASWTENIQGQIKYIMLNPSSRLKGEKDWQKYEKARKLKDCIEKIRDEYMADMKSKEMRIRQRAVALYFIDKLALRAGNEKDEDQADTVGCCSLRVEHIELVEQRGDQEFIVEFDFLGKDSIRYQNAVPVEKKVFKNLKLFMENKKDGDDLFDRLNTSLLNQYLQQLMEGLTAKVFRTYNASFTLQQQLDELTDPDDNVAAKMLSYNRANREVAVLCNHQRAVPKTFDKSMENLANKIEAKQDTIKEAEKKFKAAKKAYKNGGSAAEKTTLDKAKKTLERLMEQLEKLEIQRTDRDENKTIALGTSKLNYLDPRISVAWCKKHEVPIEKVYNKTQREKFRWAIDMIMNSEEEYTF